jgi:hypothetical protein
MTESTGIRVELKKATPMDAVKILGIFKKSHAENMGDFPDVIDDDAITWIINVITHGIAIVACIDDRIVGSFGGVIMRHGWNSKEHYLKGEWFCALNKYKDSAIHTAIMRKVKKDANITKDNIMFSFYGDDSDTLEKTYLNAGMIPLGKSMLWKGKPESEVAIWVKD